MKGVSSFSGRSQMKMAKANAAAIKNLETLNNRKQANADAKKAKKK